MATARDDTGETKLGSVRPYESPGNERTEIERNGHSFMGLVRELLRESEALVRAEADLLRTEFSEKVTQAQRGIGAMITGGAVLFAGLLVLLAAAVFALAQVISIPWAALLVGSAVAIIGGIMIAGGRSRVTAEKLKPHRTIADLKADRDFVKERAS